MQTSSLIGTVDTVESVPIFNATIAGIMNYLLIAFSNSTDPTIGAIIYNTPIGITGLLAIDKGMHHKFIYDALIINIILCLMWIIILHLINLKININYALLIGFIIWLILCIIYRAYRY